MQMKTENIQENIESKLAERCPEVELLRVDVFSAGGRPSLRVFIDHPDGVDHQLCGRVSGELRSFLTDFSVEVSSPGSNRPLTKPEHFGKYVGQRAGIETVTPIGGRRNFKGQLIDLDRLENVVTIECQDQRIKIPHELIKRSNLLVEQSGVQRQ